MLGTLKNIKQSKKLCSKEAIIEHVLPFLGQFSSDKP
jgi:hypothetical protein